MGKLLASSDGGMTINGIGHCGYATITVWWEDGRVTHTTYGAMWQCYDVVSGNAHPFKRWEIRTKHDLRKGTENHAAK